MRRSIWRSFSSSKSRMRAHRSEGQVTWTSVGQAELGSSGKGVVMVPVPRRSQSAETSGQASRMRRIVSTVMVASWESCRFRRFWVAGSLASEFSVHLFSFLMTAIRLRTSSSVNTIVEYSFPITQKGLKNLKVTRKCLSLQLV